MRPQGRIVMTNGAPLISAQAVVKRFGALTALDGVSLDIAQGEFFGLLGPNGAGKSTFMSLVAGLRPVDGGSLTVGGSGVSAGSRAARKTLGLVPQHIALYMDLSAEKNLRIFGELFGLGGSLLAERIEEMLVAVQLADRRRQPVKEFSGGMQRRLNLAAALLHRPSLLLCDEPTVGVDPQSRNAIFDLLEAQNRAGLTIIYSTHYMEEATRMCTRIGIIDHGRILATGSVDELLAALPFEEEIRFPASAESAPLVAELAAYGEIVTTDGVSRFRPKPDFPLSRFYGLTETHHLAPRIFTSQRPTLEAVFLQLTGRTLRD